MIRHLTLNWDPCIGNGWNTNDGSIYTSSRNRAQFISGATSICVFCRRDDDIPVVQLGEIRSWIPKDGRLHIAFIVGNTYNEAVCIKVFGDSDDMSIFTMCPLAPAYCKDMWKLIWKYDIQNSRWNITGVKNSEQCRQPIAEVSVSPDKLDITFLLAIPECTVNAIIVGAVGMAALFNY
ncbi:hypothetical protein B0H10DRAFT_1957413 [Mycena sp. CBHHK59/15]|nr:hypothetical protein B0H10DRAFT_1957413 [Mycena sp. CBHHK59/15]